MPMFSFTLVHKIEANAAQIAEEIRGDHRLPATHVLGDHEILGRARHLTENFGHWLAAREAEIQGQLEPLGRARFDESVPLHELILCLQIVERKIVAFARESTTGTVLQIYAEEELQYRVNRLFGFRAGGDGARGRDVENTGPAGRRLIHDVFQQPARRVRERARRNAECGEGCRGWPIAPRHRSRGGRERHTTDPRPPMPRRAPPAGHARSRQNSQMPTAS